MLVTHLLLPCVVCCRISSPAAIICEDLSSSFPPLPLLAPRASAVVLCLQFQPPVTGLHPCPCALGSTPLSPSLYLDLPSPGFWNNFLFFCLENPPIFRGPQISPPPALSLSCFSPFTLTMTPLSFQPRSPLLLALWLVNISFLLVLVHVACVPPEG